MNNKNENMLNNKYVENNDAILQLLKKINANVKTDKALKKQKLKGGYVSWPQDKK